MTKSDESDRFDVIVAGGGPAGTATATLLQRRGHRCVVLEASRFPRYHIGESLIPHTYGILDRLGLLPRLRQSSFPQKHSVRFVSETGQHSQPFYFSETVPVPRAQTWQVERSQFDQMCLDNARAAGVEVREQCQVSEVLFEDDRAVGVRVDPAGADAYDLNGSVVVDASGRGTLIGEQLGLKGPVPQLVKGAIWSYYRGGARLDGIDAGETTVFMLPRRGWFWYIPLPDDIVSVGVVADPDYLFDETDDMEQVFAREVKRCMPLSQRLAAATRTEPVRGGRPLAYWNSQIVGNGWIMVGDAAAFLDPIYSSGLFLALTSAALASDCIDDALAVGDYSADRLGRFVRPLSQGIEVIRRLIHAFYDPDFHFSTFLERYPQHKAALIDCLVGDVVNKDMTAFLEALATMTPPPPPLV